MNLKINKQKRKGRTMKLLLNILVKPISILIATFICIVFLKLGYFDTWGSLIKFAIILAVVNTFIKPIVKIIALPITAITFGLFAIVINVAMIFFAIHLVPGVQMTGVISAFILTIVIAITTIVVDVVI